MTASRMLKTAISFIFLHAVHDVFGLVPQGDLPGPARVCDIGEVNKSHYLEFPDFFREIGVQPIFLPVVTDLNTAPMVK